MRYAKWLTALKMESSRTSQRFKTGLDSIHISLFGWSQEIPNPQIDGKITTLILSGWSQETDNGSLPNWRPDQNILLRHWEKAHCLDVQRAKKEVLECRGHCWRFTFWATPKGDWPGMRQTDRQTDRHWLLLIMIFDVREMMPISLSAFGRSWERTHTKRLGPR